MVFGKSKLELRVGIFVFFGVTILIFFILMIGDFKTWGSSRKINFMFGFVNGIKVGAPIRFAGVDVGEVREIKFLFSPEEQKTRVQAVGLIKREINIPADSKVWVNTLGLLGEKYLEVMPGKDYSNCLADGQELVGNDPLGMHEMGELAKSITDNLNEAMIRIKNKQGTLGKLLYEDGLYNELEALLNNAEAMLKNKEGTVGRLFNYDSIYRGLEDLVADIKAHPWKLFLKGKEKPVKK